MKSFKVLIFCSFLITVIMLSSLHAVLPSEVQTALSQECMNVLKDMGIDPDDLSNKDKALEFREKHMYKPEWEKIKLACSPANSNLQSHNCDECDKLCLGNCACFVTWCYYNCPCK